MLIRFRLPLAILIALCSLVLACSDDSSTPNSPNQFNVGENTSPDVEFVLQNHTDQPLYVQRGTLPAPGWLSVFMGGEELTIQWDCGLPCPCDESTGCAMCGMAPPSVEALDAGDELRLQWDGMNYAVQTLDGHSCFEKIQLRNESLSAEICYSFDHEEDDFSQSLNDPQCETVNFQQGTDEEVVVTVDEAPEPVAAPEVTFVLENDLNIPVHIQHGVEPNPGWLSVLVDSEPIHVMRDCSLPCECPDPDSPDTPVSCMDCGMVLPFTDKLQPDDHISHTWDGLQYQVADGCFERVQHTDQPMAVTFCYGFDTQLDDYEEHVTDPQCETVDFRIGTDEEVRVTIEDVPEPPPTVEPNIDFVLENDRGEPILIQHGVMPWPSWLTVFQGEEPIHVEWDCGMPCPCEESQGCMVCGMPLPYVEELADGDEVRFSWDGIKHAVVDTEQGACYDTIQLNHESMSAEFCYASNSVTDVDGGEYLDDPTCDTVDFELSVDGEARVIAE